MNPSSIEKQIEEALVDYFKVVELQKSVDSVQLRAHFEKLDNLSTRLNHHATPRLRHFMVQKSYQKALQLLQNQESK